MHAFLDAAVLAEREFMPVPPAIDLVSIVSGLAGMFSGFKNRVLDIASRVHVDPRDVFLELSRPRAVAGHGDLMFDGAMELS